MQADMPTAAQLAALAREHRVPFNTLVARWLDGLRGEQLVESKFIRKGDAWLSTVEASDAIGVHVTWLRTANSQLPKWCRRRPWSKNAKKPQGCGTLFWKRDIDLVVSIMQGLDLNFRFVAKLLHHARTHGYRFTIEREQ